MDIDDSGADCSSACIRQADVCVAGNRSPFRCYMDYRRCYRQCLSQCTADAREERNG